MTKEEERIKCGKWHRRLQAVLGKNSQDILLQLHYAGYVICEEDAVQETRGYPYNDLPHFHSGMYSAELKETLPPALEHFL